MTWGIRFNAGAALALAAMTSLFAGPAFADPDDGTNLFNIVTPLGATYIEESDVVACGAGKCKTTLRPAEVVPLSGLGLIAPTLNLIGDVAAQKPGYTVAFAPSLNATLSVDLYAAFNNGASGGAELGFNIAAAKDATLPANLHWVQVVTDNYNIKSGINGADLMAAKGLGKPENVVDAPFDPSPYYDVSAASNTNPRPFNAKPPIFGDRSGRPEPTAVVPTITWTANLFLVSDPGTKTMTVYDAVQWGWVTQYSANGVFAAIPEPASWALILAGAGFVGVGLRRRRALSTPV